MTSNFIVGAVSGLTKAQSPKRAKSINRESFFRSEARRVSLFKTLCDQTDQTRAKYSNELSHLVQLKEPDKPAALTDAATLLPYAAGTPTRTAPCGTCNDRQRVKSEFQIQPN